MTDAFRVRVFKSFFQRVFDCNAGGRLRMGFDAEISVHTSPEMECCGAVGAINAAGSGYSSNSKDRPRTSRWKTGAIGETTAVAFYFDASGSHLRRTRGFLQLQTRYVQPSGHVSLRVTTVAHSYANFVSEEVLNGFDYQAAAALVARQSVAHADVQSLDTIHDWLDALILRVTCELSTWEEGKVSSLQVQQRFACFLQMLHHLKRSVLAQDAVYMSPDDAAFRWSLILQENTCHTCQMIQPTLLQYSYLEPSPKPVTLADAIQAIYRDDTILVMDLYFLIVHWPAEQVASWVEAGYHMHEQYRFFKEWLSHTKDDAAKFGNCRLIPPRLVNSRNAGKRLILRAAHLTA